ncbi:MAG TPA: ABC transporter permease subunit [Symbiobacteriaceae bacterium]|nr:ABC transporter permease subunit [Symbiobacteriaceae bacterium]
MRRGLPFGIQKHWPGAVGLLAFLALWQVGALTTDPIILPSPLSTGKALVRLTTEGRVAGAALATALHTLGGFGLAAALGGALGLGAGLSATVRRMLAPVVTIVQGVPQIAWIVLALLWFGSNSATTPVFTVAVGVLPVIFAAVVSGVSTADRPLLEMARSFSVPKAMLLTDIYLPHLVSYLFPAVTAGLGIGWKVAVMAELMAGADRGVGAGLARARTNLEVADAFAWIAVIVVMMFGLEYLVLHPLRRWLEPWRTGQGEGGRRGAEAEIG